MCPPHHRAWCRDTPPAMVPTGPAWGIGEPRRCFGICVTACTDHDLFLFSFCLRDIFIIKVKSPALALRSSRSLCLGGHCVTSWGGMGWAGSHNGPAMGGEASSSTLRRGAWGQGARCQGPGHHEEGAALHVAPPPTSLGALQPQLGVGWFCAGGELLPWGLSPLREWGWWCPAWNRGCHAVLEAQAARGRLHRQSLAPEAAAVGFGVTHAPTVCYGVWSTSGAACRHSWPPWPWFGVHDHLVPRAGSTWRKQRLSTGHSFVGICLLLAAGGTGGRGSRTDPCEQTSRAFSERGR